MTIDEIYAIPVDGDGWRLLPSGNKLMIGPNVQAPDGINLYSIGAWASIGEGASIGARANIGEGAGIGVWASIGEGASIGAWANIGVWAKFEKSPLAVQGSRHIAIQNSPGKIAVGCHVHTYAQWKRCYKSIGNANGYTPEQIEEYGRILDFLIANSTPAEAK